jgi:hypothetical protein
MAGEQFTDLATASGLLHRGLEYFMFMEFYSCISQARCWASLSGIEQRKMEAGCKRWLDMGWLDAVRRHESNRRRPTVLFHCCSVVCNSEVIQVGDRLLADRPIERKRRNRKLVP